MDKIKFKLVDGELLCDYGCPSYKYAPGGTRCIVDNGRYVTGDISVCIPGLRQQRDEARADLAKARAVIEKLEVRVDEPCDDCAITERDEARAVIERVREVSRNFDCTNPEKSKHELCRALLPAPATGEDGG